MSSRFVRWSFTVLALTFGALGCATHATPSTASASVQPCPITPDCPCQHGRAPARVAVR
jgi:hypothetical protein